MADFDSLILVLYHHLLLLCVYMYARALIMHVAPMGTLLEAQELILLFKVQCHRTVAVTVALCFDHWAVDPPTKICTLGRTTRKDVCSFDVGMLANTRSKGL